MYLQISLLLHSIPVFSTEAQETHQYSQTTRVWWQQLKFPPLVGFQSRKSALWQNVCETRLHTQLKLIKNIFDCFYSDMPNSINLLRLKITVLTVLITKG